eukprot:1316949-Alexandrium_andersonii.AAC.1
MGPETPHACTACNCQQKGWQGAPPACAPARAPSRHSTCPMRHWSCCTHRCGARVHTASIALA